VIGAFARIDAWLEAHAPEVLARLRPGASEEELAGAETALGRALPTSLRTSYGAHDGAKDDMSRAIFGGVRAPEWIHYMSWLPIQRALDHAEPRTGVAGGSSSDCEGRGRKSPAR